MAAPNWTASDFLSAFIRLLPRGRAWQTGSPTSTAISYSYLESAPDVDILTGGDDPLVVGSIEIATASTSNEIASLATLMPTYERQTARANYLLVDAFPATTDELLPEWQSTLGLPDPCAGPSPTLAQSQGQVVARLTGRGGQSAEYFIQFAASLGYDITITQFTPSRFGRPFGLAFGGEAWAYAWQINAPQFTVNKLPFGGGQFGQPFASWGNTVLQCEMNRLKPAHTILLFSYS